MIKEFEAVTAQEAPLGKRSEAKESVPVPPELSEIYDDKVPPVVLETFKKIRNGKTLADFLKTKVAEVAEEKGKAAELAERRQKIAEQARGKGNKKNKKQNPAKKVAQAVASETPSATEPVPEIPPIAQALEGLEQEEVDRNIAATHPSISNAHENESLSSILYENKSDELDPEAAHRDDQMYANTDGFFLNNKDDIPEHTKRSLDAGETRAGWKSKLRELVGKFGEGVSERFTNSKNYLDERAKELDAKAEMSGGEKWLRIIGERYNKLSLIHKLGIGVTLGVGTAVGAAFSLPLALTGMSGLVVQRAVGAAGMFVSIEKKLQEKKVGESYQWMAVKERAALDALLYTAVMGAAISKGLEVARDYELVEKTREWLGSMLGHSATAPNAPDVKAETYATEPVSAEVHEPAAAAAAAEAVTATPAAPEMPSATPAIDVKATPGHGYEYMMKQLWGQLHEHNVSLPEGASSDSDLARLLAADESSIDKVVHQIASDPRHSFVRHDGSSVSIDLSARMTIGEHGELHLIDEATPISHDYTIAPAHAPVTPAPHIEVSTPVSEVSVSPSEVPVEAPVAPIEASAQELPPLQEVMLPEQQPIQTVDITSGVERPPESIDTTVQPESSGVSVPEAQSIVNAFNVEVSTTEPHLYVGTEAENVFIYGGASTEQTGAILKYLTENPKATVYGADANGHRVPWNLIEGKAVSGTPVQTAGIFGLFKSFMDAPRPDEFAKIIK